MAEDPGHKVPDNWHLVYRDVVAQAEREMREFVEVAERQLREALDSYRNVNMTDRTILKAAVDPVVTAVDSTHMLLPKTGHILSLPRVEDGEGFIGYFERVYLQAGATEEWMQSTVSSVGYGASMPRTERVTGHPRHDWPVMIDAFCNPEAYQ